MKKSAALLVSCMMIFAPLARPQNGTPPGAYSPGGSSGGASAPYLEINAAAAPYNVIGDGRFSYSATFTNTSSSVTCPSTDCGFVASDVGKVCTGFTVPQYGTEILPTGCKITAVNSATNVTVSVAANGNSAGTATQVFYYGTDQTTGVTSAITAMHALYHCGAIRWPGGYITIKGNGTTSPYGAGVNCQASGNIDFPGEDFGGLGKDVTNFVLLPDFGNIPFIFNNAAGTGPGHFHDFHINCMGWSAYTPAGLDTAMLAIYNDSTLSNIKISGCGQTNDAVKMAAGTGFCSVYNLYIEYSGSLESKAQECSFYNLYYGSQFLVTSGSIVNDYGDQAGQGAVQGSMINLQAGSTYNCIGGRAQAGGATVNIRIGSASKVVLNACAIGPTSAPGTSYGVYWDGGGGTVYCLNGSTISAGSNGALNNVNNNTPANFYDDGTCSFNGSITNFTGQTNSKYFYSPHNVGNVSKTAQVAAIGAATLFTTGGTTALYRAHVSVECTTTSAAATVTPSILYTDTAGTVQTVTGTAATCTAANAAANTSQDVTFRAKNATNIQYQTTIANTPTYDISVAVEQLSVF